MLILLPIDLKMHSKHLISKEIAAFYEDIITDDCQNVAEEFFNSNHTLKFMEIYSCMLSALSIEGQNQFIENFQNLEYEDFLLIYKKISPILKQCEIILRAVNIEELNLNWLGGCQFIKAALKNAPNNFYERGTENVEKILLLTAMLEFALGSIFYTTSGGKTPPHLLKDLLCTVELQNFFGYEALSFLKIIIGTPKSVNLRNIVWHGFPKPEAIPSYYVSTLLTIIHTLGHMLQKTHFKLEFRKQIVDFSSSLAAISSVCNIPTRFGMDEQIYHDIFESCFVIPQDYKPYWQQLHFYRQTGAYWRFVILILPQIELTLRLLYAKFNTFDISAKLDEYYITLDTIFEPIVPNTDNQLNHFFDESCVITKGALHFLYDIFQAPKGPRLRDKISHGEVSTEAMDNQNLCQILWYLAMNLLTHNEAKYPMAKYESQFHINSYAKLALNKASKTFNEFVQEFEIKCEIGLPLNCIGNSVEIFERPKKESVYMLLITKIANFLSDTCHNFNESIRLRQSSLLHHELHSKRRRTLENLIKSLPSFCCTLDLILNCLFEVYTKLQVTNQDFGADAAVILQRFLKHTLRVAENLVKYSHKDSNEWIKITELTKNFDDLHERLYLKFKDIHRVKLKTVQENVS